MTSNNDTDTESEGEGEIEGESRLTLACWDCGTEISRRESSMCEVMDHSGEGMGYETYDAPLCPACVRKRVPHHECGTCGREYPDIEAAATCCSDGMRGPI